MRARQIHPLIATALVFFMAALPSCGSKPDYDWKNREIHWTYGPRTGAATSEHLTGTGTKGSGAIAAGWNCRLSDGKQLTVKPYQLAESHTLFGNAKMIIGLFDRTDQRLDTVRTEAITDKNATFTFELQEAVAKPLTEVVIWFGKV